MIIVGFLAATLRWRSFIALVNVGHARGFLDQMDDTTLAPFQARGVPTGWGSGVRLAAQLPSQVGFTGRKGHVLGNGCRWAG